MITSQSIASLCLSELKPIVENPSIMQIIFTCIFHADKQNRLPLPSEVSTKSQSINVQKVSIIRINVCNYIVSLGNTRIRKGYGP